MCIANGVIKKGGELPCPVDASGIFTDVVTDFKNQYVKVSYVLFCFRIVLGQGRNMQFFKNEKFSR